MIPCDHPGGMLPWNTLATASVPNGGELTLARRDDEYVLRADGQVLMSSRQHGSEDAMPGALPGTVRTRSDARVLVGGLGFGFTLRATLDLLSASATVIVAELVPDVVEWNRSIVGGLAGAPLKDPRVHVAIDNVSKILQRETRLDGILLDVDNGPAALVSDSNRRLYTPAGVRTMRHALREGGAFVVWSAGESASFARLVRDEGFDLRVAAERARGKQGGTTHVLYVATRR